MPKNTFCLLASILVLLIGCQKPEEDTLFTLMSSETTGIDFNNSLQSSPELNILEYLYFYNGGGVAVGDINNDGLVDIYFNSNQGENKLYLNKGNFNFEEISQSAGVTGDGGWSTGVTMADVNGDGLLDIYVCQIGDYKGLKGKNKLYINNGDLTFTEKASEYGIDFIGFSTQALFFDYDNDGDLDLYLLNHSIKKPEVFSAADTRENRDEMGGDRLFKNLAAQGEERMTDVTEEAGIFSSSLGFGLGIAAADLNGDGFMDLYVANDFTEDDYLYLNNGDGTFREALSDAIHHTSRYSMGNDINDFNNDGFPDIFTTDMLPENPEIWMKSVGEDKAEVFAIKKNFGYKDQYVRNHLQLNLGNGMFSEIALLTGTYATDWSWSPLIFDMDNDGYKDLHITNGIVKRPNDLDFIQYSQEPTPGLSDEEIEAQQIKMLPTVKLPNYSYHNQGDFRFENKSSIWGLDQASYSTGSAYADLDNDGDLDLIINNVDQPAFIYRNNSSEQLGYHFIQFQLNAGPLNPFGIGTQVRIYRAGEILHQTVANTRGFQSGVDPRLTFGLGKEEKIDSIQVIWPGNQVEIFDLDIGKNHVLRQGDGREVPYESPLTQLAVEEPEIFESWKHQENREFNPEKREYLLPKHYSSMGPALAVADVNGDGLDDLYLGGAKGQPGALFLQQPNGEFTLKPTPIFEQLKLAEDVVAVFFDANQNGFPDLYVGSGGQELNSGELFNYDRLFLNDGQGNLVFSPNALPPLGENTGALAIHDVNGDGYPDIFVGAQVVTGNYGAAPYSYLLINDGQGKFRDATEHYFGAGFRPGMVNAAQWADLDGDGVKELILAGDWMPVQVYKKTSDGKFKRTPITGLDDRAGWYNTVSIEDVNGDGHLDILVGNLGLNSKLKASKENPIYLYHHDFDGNGQDDPLIFHYMGDQLVPFATRDDLIKQLPVIKKQHESYFSYAQIRKPSDLFGNDVLRAAHVLEVNELRSGYFLNNGNGDFDFHPFPIKSQFSPIMALHWYKDSSESMVLTAGNFYDFRHDLGKSAAMPFTRISLSNGMSTIFSNYDEKTNWGQYRRMVMVKKGGKKYLLAVRNDDHPVWIPLP
ncbi:VCBS repeat-containing protein [Pararhodonellum marinum]|uniref:VCBS repeat-containing protein n=1 Tax=Pararhodonellum marinum TaxID=2755358 RepID=UPI0018905CA9|nr:VCBS repeat-containing protein [Pararhodonellum marinum]